MSPSNIKVDILDVVGRIEILHILMKNYNLYDDLDLNVIAEGTEGYSRGDLAAVCNEAYLQSLREEFNVFEPDLDSLDCDIMKNIKVTKSHQRQLQTCSIRDKTIHLQR